jgi:predicted site-specific integrase-resolvase
MSKSLPYPPPWQDAPTLCAHLCISETTLDTWVRQGILPPAKAKGGKRMWKWSEVEQYLDTDSGIVPERDLARRVYDATKKAAANG